MVVIISLRRKRNKSQVNNAALNFATMRTERLIRSVNYTLHDKDINVPLTNDELIAGTHMGIDSHADTTCVNKHAHIESIVEGMTVDAIPFDQSIGKLTNLPIVNAIYAYDNPNTLITTLLRFSHSIYVKDMDNALLCPNQARENGTIVDDVPPNLDHTGRSTFSIFAGDVEIPLLKNGPTAAIHLRRPTLEELEYMQEDIIDVTCEHGWEPYRDESLTYANISKLSREMHDVTISDCLDDWLLYNHCRRIKSLHLARPKDKLTPEYLAQIWNCGIDTARKTIEASTCQHYRTSVNGLTKRYRPSRDHMRYRQLRLPAGEFYTDTMMSKIKSIRGFSCAQIYGNKFGYIKAYPIENKDKQSVGDTLTMIIQDTGVMAKLHTDNAPEMIGRQTPFFKRARKEGIDLTTIEPLRPDENYAEILVRKAKALSGKLMIRKNVPLRLWCYALEYACDLSSLMVPNMYRNKGRSGYEMVFGHTPDISEYVEFQFYDYCWYWDTPQSYPHGRRNLGRWLGIAHRVGQSMVFYVMNINGKVIARSTVSRLEKSDYDVTETKARMTNLDKAIEDGIGDCRNTANISSSQLPDLDSMELQSQLSFCFEIDPDQIDDTKAESFSNQHIPYVDDSPSQDIESAAFDKFLGIYVNLPGSDGESNILGRVKNRKRDHDGRLIGTTNPNPILNTAVYNVETPDGNIHEYTVNIIAENLYDQTDDDGYDYRLLYEIIGHRKTEDAIEKANGYYTTKSGTERRVITTKGWDLQVRWENGDTSFIPLKDIKETNPIEVAEYAITNKLEREPTFAWRVKPALK